MKVLIIGAGIAGPALAVFLRRLGHEVTVCEARPDDGAGAFLTLAPNGMHVLAQLGVRDEVERAGAEMLGMKFQNARGQAIGEIDLRDSRTRFGAPSITIRRSALQRALIDAARAAGTDLRFGQRVDSLDQAADLIIGCDGIRSRVRTLLFPDAKPPRLNGLFDFGGITQAQEDLEEGWMHMVFGKRAFFGVQRQGDTLYWFHNGPSRENIAALHADDPPFIRAIIERSTIQGPWPQHDILGLPRWHQGNVCLIGDAAHATTPSAGQGASLALEDAAVLARCLRNGQDFATFQALRYQRVNAIVRASRRTGNSKAPGPVGAWFRDRMMARFLEYGARAQAEAMGFRADLQ